MPLLNASVLKCMYHFVVYKLSLMSTVYTSCQLIFSSFFLRIIDIDSIICSGNRHCSGIYATLISWGKRRYYAKPIIYGYQI